MKKLDRSIGRAVFNRLSQTRGLQDSISFAHQCSVDKPYLVGGRLYRTLVELMFGYVARSSCSDFDWATPRTVDRKKISKEKYATFDFARTRPRGRKIFSPIQEKKKQNKVEGCVCPSCDEARLGKGGYKYSPGSYKRNTKFGNKFDLIDIRSLPNSRGGSIEDYLEAVPLSIQSLAMDIENYSIFGTEGIKSLKEQCVWTNNIENLLCYSVNKGIFPDDYIEDKAKSIRFYPCEYPYFIAEGHKNPYENIEKWPTADWKAGRHSGTYMLQPGTAYVPSVAMNMANTPNANPTFLTAFPTAQGMSWNEPGFFTAEYSNTF